MAYSFAGTPAGNYLAGPSTIGTGQAATYSAGDCVIWVVGYASSTATATLSDGSSNVYTQIAGGNNSGSSFFAFVCFPTNIGARTVTASISASVGDITTAYLGAYQGLSALQAGAVHDPVNPTVTGTNATVSTAVTPTAQPGALVGIVCNGYNVTLTSGTTPSVWNSRGTAALAGGYVYSMEDLPVTSLSAASSYWTYPTAGHRVNLITFVLSEVGGAIAPASYPMSSEMYF